MWPGLRSHIKSVGWCWPPGWVRMSALDPGHRVEDALSVIGDGAEVSSCGGLSDVEHGTGSARRRAEVLVKRELVF